MTPSPTPRLGPHPVDQKTDADLRREWDAIAEDRLRQIQDHLDLSYHAVLVPTVIRLVGDLHGADVLDAGCGSGSLTKRLAADARRVVAVDLSERQVSLATSHNGGSNITYIASSLQDFARANLSSKFTLLVANMTLMDVLDLTGFLAAASRLLRVGGLMVFTITHPWFWPLYWDYFSEPWFRYDREVIIEAPFRISLDGQSLGSTTHVHRPLGHYQRALRDAGLQLDTLTEPMPSRTVEAQYPRPWAFPRYLAAACTRVEIRG
jgi:SAM-dependent methyltransferase